jgi:hypothetical protein
MQQKESEQQEGNNDEPRPSVPHGRAGCRRLAAIICHASSSLAFELRHCARDKVVLRLQILFHMIIRLNGHYPAIIGVVLRRTLPAVANEMRAVGIGALVAGAASMKY